MNSSVEKQETVQSVGLVERLPPWLLVVVSIISVETGAAFAKQLFDTAGTAGVVFIRTFIGAIIFTVIWRPRFRGYSRKVYLYMVLYGATIAGNMLIFYATISRIPLGITVAIAFAGPLLVAVLGSRKTMDFVWVVVAAVGIILLSPLTNVTLDGFGMVLAGLVAVAWALYILVTKRVSGIMEGHTMLAFSMCVAALVALPFGGAGAVKVLADPALIGRSLLVALLSSAIPFSLEFTAMKRMSSRVFGLLASVEPVAAAIIGLVVLHEALGIKEVLGIGLVTIAAFATARDA